MIINTEIYLDILESYLEVRKQMSWISQKLVYNIGSIKPHDFFIF